MATQAVDREKTALVDQARQGWVRRLIDLSRRNNLLYFRELKTGTLNLSGAPPDAVDALLRGQAVELLKLAPAEREGDEVRTTAKVQEIRRRAVTNFEERGLATLFVSLGSATWAEEDEGRPPDAPAFLLPVAIENKGREGRNPVLRRAGDLQANAVLLHVLEVEHGINLSGEALLRLVGTDGADDESFDFPGAYEEIRRVASRVRGFAVNDRAAFLGNFSFQKLAMVKDLKEAGDALATHDLVAALAGHLGARRALSEQGDSIEPSQLDRTPPEQEFLVLDADSSQQIVVASALSGRSGLVQGPPGTGKSQTIANLIAELAARGRKILFVAEKRAALEVVLRRLEAVGLGHLTLDLHGAEVDRRKIMAKVSETLIHVREAMAVDMGPLQARFVEIRARLNEHVARLHAQRAPSGMSVYQLQGLLLQGSSYKATTRWRGPELDRLDGAAASAIQDLLKEAAGFGGLLLHDHPSPWTGARLPDGKTVQDAIDCAQRLAGTSVPAFMGALHRVVRDTGMRLPAQLKEASALADLLEGVAVTLKSYRRELFSQNLDGLTDALAPARTRLNAIFSWCVRPAYRQALALVRSLRRDPKARPSDVLAEVLAAGDQRRRWRAASRPDAIPEVPPDRERFVAFLRAVEADVHSLASRLPCDLLSLPLEGLGRLVRSLFEDTTTPHRLPRLFAIEQGLKARGAGPLVAEIRAGKPDVAVWPALFHQAWVASCLDRARLEDPALAGFNGQSHAGFVEEFKALDSERLRVASARVRRAHAERAVAAMNAHPDQDDLIRREAAKKTRHLPLRRLVDQAPDVLATLHPCWMASPLSVSQLLPADRRLFDIVLFDEASQVLPEDAVPSIMRGSHAIVAGDVHQLPPTTFFVGGEEEEEEATGASEGFESILHVMSAFLRSWSLDWHYRSRDEALIAFSNRHIYNNRLVTFPGPGGDPGLSHVLVPQATDQDGQEDSSAAEVRRVVELVVRHALERPSETLGVIAMGIIHAKRVQMGLDLALRDHPNLDAFFDQSKAERFFVKNLERVQGDERDAIILTIGYGKDRSGRLPYRFGPLLIDGGERRLNVAVTRARQRLTLVSSFGHFDMDPGRSRAKGVELLRLYIEYAASGGKRLGQTAAAAVPLNPFEQDVMDALTAQGLSLLPQWGASTYRIDLVAQHPNQRGQYVLAIECDGASYHAAHTARDRDRLRQQHLEALGWRFHRIWSTDWFMRRDEEITRTLAAFRAAVAYADGAKSLETPDRADPPLARSGNNEPAPRGPRPAVPRREKIDDYQSWEIDRILQWIQSDGRLRTDDELVDAMTDELGFSRRGNRIVDSVRAAIARAKR
jgi:hypothetical protein